MKGSMRSWYKALPGRPYWWTILGLMSIMGMSLAVRLPQPISDPSIGEIDVYYWALRTQEFLLYGWPGIGTPLWVTPVVMGAIHTIIGGSLYDLFLWAGPFMTAIVPPLGVYLLTREMTKSTIAGLFGALAIAVSPVILYRSVFTVSESFAYILIPWTLYLAVRQVRVKSIWNFLGLVTLVLVAMKTHDSSKLLVLPAVVASIIFFWDTRRAKRTWILFGLSVVGAALLLFIDKSILAEIRFFLQPNNAGNSAFGKYPPVPLSDYLAVSSVIFSAFTLVGLVTHLVTKKASRRALVIVTTFLLPILFYQQIQPRISDSTIVPFRLTPYLAFLAAPVFGLAVTGWLRLVKNVPRLSLAVMIVAFFLSIARIGIADFPLPYVTGTDEQRSLLRLPITSDDYLITQTSMIGMTGVATRTNEHNYFGDLTDRVFGAQTGPDVLDRVRSFTAASPTRPTGVLISKWKLIHRDPRFGWWDSLMNPAIQLTAWRASGLPVRFEDANIIIFNIPDKV